MEAGAQLPVTAPVNFSLKFGQDAEIDAVDRPQKKAGLEMHQVGGEFVIYEAESDAIHSLNTTAALVLEFCDGAHTAAEIAAEMQQAYQLPAPPLDEVNGCLINLQQSGLIH